MAKKPGKGETMGERLKRLREEKGFTQLQLAAQAEVSLGALRNWEQDRRGPLLETAVKLARCLDISLDELVGDFRAEEEPAPKKGKGKGKKK